MILRGIRESAATEQQGQGSTHGGIMVSVLESTTPPFTAHDAHKKTSSGEFGLPLRFLPIRCPT
jgi:hypothetical protein